MATGINVSKSIKVLDEGLQIASDINQIDFTGGVTATASGNNITVNVPAAGITVGTTPVTSGTNTRVFFQEGGVVQQDANFTFNNTQKRLTLKAVGTAATDIPFAIRNSADTANLVDIQGNGQSNFYGDIRSLTANSSNAIGVQNTFDTTNTSSAIELTRPTIGGGYFSGNGNTKILFHSAIRTNTYMQVASEYYSRAIRTVISADADSGAYANNQIEFHVAGWGVSGGANASSLRMLINKTGQVAIGTSTPGARLDVRAQGALSTDIAFRVRNSGDTVNTFAIQGDGNILQLINSTGAFTLQKGFNIGATNDSSVFQAYMSNSSGANRAGFLAQTAGAGYSYLFHDYGSSGGGGSTSGNLFHNTGAGAAYFNFASIGGNSNGFRFIKNTGTSIDGTQGKMFQIAPSAVTWYQSVVSIGTYCGASQSTTPVAAYGGNTLFIANGTAPTTTDTDSFGMYSADIVAGNAAPHFRTESGDIIKLYRETTANLGTGAAFVNGTGAPITEDATFGGYTIAQITKALANFGLLQ